MTLGLGRLSDSEIAHAELFGPVLIVIRYDEDAVRIAHNSIFGLSGGVYGPIPNVRSRWLNGGRSSSLGYSSGLGRYRRCDLRRGDMSVVMKEKMT